MKHPVIDMKVSFQQNLSHLIQFYHQHAIKYLQKQNNTHENIHQARLCFKRIRSFLRLGRDGMGVQLYSVYNAFYRDQARALSQLRDSTALLETLPSFIESNQIESSNSLLHELECRFKTQREQQFKTLISSNIIAHVILVLQNSLKEIERWDFQGDASDVFVAGAQRVYSSGRKLFRLTLENPDDHHFHEWRKQVKYSWYHLVVLTNMWPVIMSALAGEVQKLSQMLGKHHDFFLFENYLKSAEFEPIHREQAVNLLETVQLKKLHLEQESFALGSKIYFESPSAYGKRLKAYWQQ